MNVEKLVASEILRHTNTSVLVISSFGIISQTKIPELNQQIDNMLKELKP